jgi:hypothetical protein
MTRWLPFGTTLIALGVLAALSACTTAADPSAAPPVSHPSSAPGPGTTSPARAAGTASAVRPATQAPAPLRPGTLPGAAAQSWKPSAVTQTPPAGHDIGLNECATVRGAVTWQQQGYASVHDTPAVQDTFVFPSAAGAADAYQAVTAAMATCEARSRSLQGQAGIQPDASVTRTAQTDSGTAWARRWTGVGGISAPGAQVNHVYAAFHGAVLTVLQITDIPGKTPLGAIDTGNDATVLTVLTTSLGG